MISPSAAVGEISTDLRSGFACGEEDVDGVVHLRMNNVARDGNFNWSRLRRVPRSIFKNELQLLQGDVLINATNSPELVGKTALFRGFHEPVAFSNHFLRLRVDPTRADPGYVARWFQLQFGARVFEGMCRQWVNQASVSREQVSNLRIPLPPLDEQRRIAAILDQADALRRKRRKALARLADLRRAFYLGLFGDPATNDKGWCVRKLGEVGELERGVSKHRPRNDPILLGGLHPLVQTGDVANADGVIRTYTNTYSDMGLKQSRIWPRGTLCITIAANIGKAAILDFDACFPDSVVGFVASDLISKEYVQSWLGFVQKTLEESAPQSAQKNINLAILRDLDIPVPPRQLQERFRAALAAIGALRLTHAVGLAQLDALFASLQHRAFRGEL